MINTVEIMEAILSCKEGKALRNKDKTMGGREEESESRNGEAVHSLQRMLTPGFLSAGKVAPRDLTYSLKKASSGVWISAGLACRE